MHARKITHHALRTLRYCLVLTAIALTPQGRLLRPPVLQTARHRSPSRRQTGRCCCGYRCLLFVSLLLPGSNMISSCSGACYAATNTLITLHFFRRCYEVR
ncbi:hypothetical protein WDV93_05495 [Pantoea ananatis]